MEMETAAGALALATSVTSLWLNERR